MLKKLRELDSDKVFSDPAQFERLQTQAADAVKRFEFNLRRKTELKGNEVLLSGDGDVPEEFRKLVERVLQVAVKGSDTRSGEEVKDRDGDVDGKGKSEDGKETWQRR